MNSTWPQSSVRCIALFPIPVKITRPGNERMRSITCTKSSSNFSERDRTFSASSSKVLCASILISILLFTLKLLNFDTEYIRVRTQKYGICYVLSVRSLHLFIFAESMEIEKSLFDNLQDFFGFDTFKGEQEAIITNVLNRKDTFVIMPTGGGKSICYQLPAMMSAGTAIVISPLIALMKNQVDQLRAFEAQREYSPFFKFFTLQKRDTTGQTGCARWEN